VQARDEAIHHGLGDQLKAGDGGEDGGLEEALEHKELNAALAAGLFLTLDLGQSFLGG
jgi:hypothetical protein